MAEETETAFQLARPEIGPEEERLVLEVLRSGQLSLGPMLNRFEECFADWLGVEHVVATSSGTAALHLGVRAMGWGEGDSVVLSPFTFVASANALLYEGVRPRFADVDPVTLNLRPDTAEGAIDTDTVGLMPIDIFGFPSDATGFEEVAGRRGLELLEDAAQAIGAVDPDGHKVGSRGIPTGFAFYANKQITTGEGGVLVCPDEGMAERVRSERNQGRAPDMSQMDHTGLGFNYRMSDIAAAIGVAQMERIDELLARRAEVAALYSERLASIPGLTLPQPGEGRARRSWFVYTVMVADGVDRDAVIAGLASSGVPSKAYLPSAHLFPQFEEFGYGPGDFTVADSASARSLALPFHAGLTEGDVDRIAAALEGALGA
ncbi:MAG: DegT/DnrJ/EryC1/StrS family aminotransferase [Solirubrobacterales bacterium]